MEKISKKRGRPSKFTIEERADLQYRYPGVGERQRQNLFYADKAKSVLRWLIETHTPEDSNERCAFIDKYEWILEQRCILTELGRILGKDWNPRELKDVEETQEALRLFNWAVGWLGEKKPNAKHAIAVLRRKRTGEGRPADAQDLAHKIAVTIIDYLTTHDCDDDWFIRQTLNMVHGALTEILASRKST